METTVYIKRENQSPLPVKLKTVRQNGQWLAVAEIPTRTGPVRLTAMASEQTVADLIKRGVAKLPAEMTTSGANIFSTIAKLAQSKAAQGVLRQAQNVVKNPLFMTALSFIPGGGLAMKAAENIMGRARQGDPKAQKSVNIIASSAKKGSKKGTMLLALLQAADGIRKTFFSGEATEVDDISAQFSGWSPPWNSTTSSGSSWAPPWSGTSNAGQAQAQPPQQLPPRGPTQPAAQAPQLPQGWPQMPTHQPSTQPPTPQNMPYGAQPMWPPGSAYPMFMPQGWQPQMYPWPWFPRTTPKC